MIYRLVRETSESEGLMQTVQNDANEIQRVTEGVPHLAEVDVVLVRNRYSFRMDIFVRVMSVMSQFQLLWIQDSYSTSMKKMSHCPLVYNKLLPSPNPRKPKRHAMHLLQACYHRIQSPEYRPCRLPSPASTQKIYQRHSPSYSYGWYSGYCLPP